jgi:hypothetical protein
MKPWCPLSCSQQPLTALYTEPDKSNPQPHTPFTEGKFSHSPSMYLYILADLICWDILPKPSTHSHAPNACYKIQLFILLDLIIRIILCEEYKLSSSSFLYSVHALVNTALRGPTFNTKVCKVHDSKNSEKLLKWMSVSISQNYRRACQ